MSLRDFNNAPFPDDPRALHNDPLGNGAGLENFHTVQPDDIEPNNTPKIVGAVAVALMVGVAGFALYTSGGSHSKTVVAANEPAAVAQPAPPPPAPAAASPDAGMPAQASDKAAADKAADAAPAKEPVKEASISKKHHKTAGTDIAVKSADAKSASDASSSAAAQRMAADTNQSTVQPQQQQEIAAPAASPSDVASNTVPAPAQPTEQAQPAEQAQPQPATPAAPAPAQPAGADQSAGQVNQ
jgi:hypothetical protein